jgi:hypothetical protein
VGNNQAAVVFPTTSTVHPHATTSISARENTLQGVVGSSVNKSAGCSTNVLSYLQDHTLGMDTDMYAEVLTHVGGFSLFQEFEQNSAYEVFTDCRPLKDVFNTSKNSCTKAWRSQPLLTPLIIWKHCNDCVLEGAQPSIRNLIARIKDKAAL